MIGVNTGLRFMPSGGQEAPAYIPEIPTLPTPPSAPDLPVAPTARWHPQFSQTTTSAGQVVTATDLQGHAGVSEGAAGAGPQAMTDAQGRKFWRFSGAEFLNVAAELVSDARDMSVFMVARVPRVGIKNNMFGLGARALSSHVNTNGTVLDVRSLNDQAGFIYAFGKSAATAAANSEWMIPGAQKQVIAVNSKSDGQRVFINERSADLNRAFNITGAVGAEIGRYPFSPGSAGNWGVFDLYEMAVYAPGMTDAQALSVSEAMMAAHEVAPIQHQLVLEGDSITQGTDLVTEHFSCAAILTEPGSGRIPAGWRVTNYGVSGNQVPDLVNRRDASDGWANKPLPGQNVMAFEIGRNDWPTGGGGQTVEQHYDNVVAYLNTPASGVLQKGWSARVMVNIASATTLMPQITAHRAALRDPQFRIDTASDTGQAFAGKVSLVSSDLIEHEDETRFADEADSSNTTYYAGDNTHPSVLGAVIRMTGGDTPQHGVVSGL